MDRRYMRDMQEEVEEALHVQAKSNGFRDWYAWRTDNYINWVIDRQIKKLQEEACLKTK